MRQVSPMEFVLAYPIVGEHLQRETRMLTFSEDGLLPRGSYHFLEAFCQDPRCDCRRCQFWVMRENDARVLATITLGLDAPDFHRDWVRAGQEESDYWAGAPSLEPWAQQSELAGALLQVFKAFVLPSEGYFERVRDHYRQFKEACAARSTLRSGRRRNEFCACGSGKKQKRCCGDRARQQAV